MAGAMMGFSNYLLELAPVKERPLYIGLGNTLNAPGLMAPMLGGWLASVWSYQGAFGLGAALGVASLVASLSLPDPRAGEMSPRGASP